MIEESLFYINLGLRISELREKRGITQEKLGQLIELSRVSVVNIEKGRQKPSLYLLYRLADIFNLTLIDFIGGKNEIDFLGIKSGQEDITNRDYEDISLFMKNDIELS